MPVIKPHVHLRDEQQTATEWLLTKIESELFEKNGFNPDFVIKMRDLYEKKGRLTKPQYEALENIYYGWTDNKTYYNILSEREHADD